MCSMNSSSICLMLPLKFGLVATCRPGRKIWVYFIMYIVLLVFNQQQNSVSDLTLIRILVYKCGREEANLILPSYSYMKTFALDNKLV